jgi:hypothetical protein
VSRLVLHELLGTAQPPPAHSGCPVVYVLLFDDGWWYVGETQVRARACVSWRRRWVCCCCCVWALGRWCVTSTPPTRAQRTHTNTHTKQPRRTHTGHFQAPPPAHHAPRGQAGRRHVVHRTA